MKAQKQYRNGVGCEWRAVLGPAAVFFSAATASLPALGQDEKYYQHADGHAFSLSGENIMNYHGARAYFDGEYFKQGELEAKAQ